MTDATYVSSDVRSGRLEIAAYHALLWLVVCTVLWFAWTGFTASDDEYYALAGLGWLTEFPYVAQHWGTIRAVVAIPIAVMVGTFGEREFTVVLSTCLFFLGTVSITLAMLSRIVALTHAFIACCVIATLPLFALKSTIASADLPELFFVASSFWLFLLARERSRKFGVLLGAGVCAGLAFSAHELTVALILFYGILFVLGYGIQRREYWVMAIGFFTVIIAEALYYAIAAGDPLHRFVILSTGAKFVDRIAVDVGTAGGGGALHLWTPLDPLIMLFFKHEFGFLGAASLPAICWAFANRRRELSKARETARLFAGLGLIWFLVAAIALRNMTLLPRYYMVTAYCMSIVVALWVIAELWPSRRRLAAYATCLFLVGNLAAIYVDNKNPRFAERALVEYLQMYSGPVHTDPLTAEDAEWLCRWANVDCGRVVRTPPVPGALYFYNPKNADRPNRHVRPDQVHQYQPRQGWQDQWRKDESRRVLGFFLEQLGVASKLPANLVVKLDRPNPSVTVFRVPK